MGCGQSHLSVSPSESHASGDAATVATASDKKSELSGHRTVNIKENDNGANLAGGVRAASQKIAATNMIAKAETAPDDPSDSDSQPRQAVVPAHDEDEQVHINATKKAQHGKDGNPTNDTTTKDDGGDGGRCQPRSDDVQQHSGQQQSSAGMLNNTSPGSSENPAAVASLKDSNRPLLTEEQLAKQRAELREVGAGPMFNVEDLDSRFERVGLRGIRLKPEPKKKRARTTLKAAASAVIMSAGSSKRSGEADAHEEQPHDQKQVGAVSLAGPKINGSSMGVAPAKFGTIPAGMMEGSDDSEDESIDSSDEEDEEVLDDDWLADADEDEELEEIGGDDGDGDGSGKESDEQGATEAATTEDEEEEDDGVDWTNLDTLRGVLNRAQLSKENKKEFVNALERQTFRPGEYIVHQGDHGDSFYIITEGEVVVSKTLESPEDEQSFSAVGLVVDGVDSQGARIREGVLTRLYQGHFFGEMALRQKKPRNANVRVLSSKPVQCARMMQDRFHAFQEKSVEFKSIIGHLIIEKEASKKKREEMRRKYLEDVEEEEEEVVNANHLQEMELVRKSKNSEGKVVLNGYVLQYKIGQGAFGKVYLAQKEGDERLYAVKRVDRAAMSRKNRLPVRPGTDDNSKASTASSTSQQSHAGADDLDDVLREVMVMQKLSHPNIVKLYTCFQEKPKSSESSRRSQYLYMIQEYIPNGAIQEEELDNEPIDTDICRLVFRGMLAGLQYLHWQGVVHRDIKPSNVLIDENNNAKLADFGTSALVPPDNDRLSDVQGTPAFQPPEVFTMERGSGMTYSGFAFDMWSAGASLYSLVVGRPPFMAKDEMALVEAVTNEELKIEKRMVADPFLRNLLEGLLEKDPNKRMTLPEAMTHDWVTQEGSDPLITARHKRLRLHDISERSRMAQMAAKSAQIQTTRGGDAAAQGGGGIDDKKRPAAASRLRPPPRPYAPERQNSDNSAGTFGSRLSPTTPGSAHHGSAKPNLSLNLGGLLNPKTPAPPTTTKQRTRRRSVAVAGYRYNAVAPMTARDAVGGRSLMHGGSTTRGRADNFNKWGPGASADDGESAALAEVGNGHVFGSADILARSLTRTQSAPYLLPSTRDDPVSTAITAVNRHEYELRQNRFGRLWKSKNASHAKHGMPHAAHAATGKRRSIFVKDGVTPGMQGLEGASPRLSEVAQRRTDQSAQGYSAPDVDGLPASSVSGSTGGRGARVVSVAEKRRADARRKRQEETQAKIRELCRVTQRKRLRLFKGFEGQLDSQTLQVLMDQGRLPIAAGRAAAQVVDMEIFSNSDVQTARSKDGDPESTDTKGIKHATMVGGSGVGMSDLATEHDTSRRSNGDTLSALGKSGELSNSKQVLSRAESEARLHRGGLSRTKDFVMVRHEAAAGGADGGRAMKGVVFTSNTESLSLVGGLRNAQLHKRHDINEQLGGIAATQVDESDNESSMGSSVGSTEWDGDGIEVEGGKMGKKKKSAVKKANSSSSDSDSDSEDDGEEIFSLDGDEIDEEFNNLEAEKHKHDPSLDDLSEEETNQLMRILAGLTVNPILAQRAGEVPRAADASRRGEQIESDTAELPGENDDDSDGDGPFDAVEDDLSDGIHAQTEADSPPGPSPRKDESMPFAPAGPEGASRMQASKLEQKQAKARGRAAIPMRSVPHNWGGVDSVRGIIWAAAERQGKPDYMEDRFLAIPSLFDRSDVGAAQEPEWLHRSGGAATFAVFDGHKGDIASEYLRRGWQRKLREVLAREEYSPEVFPPSARRFASGGTPTGARGGAFTSGDASDELPIGVVSAGDSMSKALIACCTELDAALLGHCKKFDLGDGSTGTAVVFMRDGAAAGDAAGLLSSRAPLRVWCANVGDTRAVLCRGGIAVELSKDHGTDDPSEVARVHSVGGAIKQRRLQGILAVTRAYGDMELKIDYKGRYVETLTGPPLIAVPDVTRRTIASDRPDDEAEVDEDENDDMQSEIRGEDADSVGLANDAELGPGIDLTARPKSELNGIVPADGRHSGLSRGSGDIGTTPSSGAGAGAGDESNFNLLAPTSRSKESEGPEQGVLDAWRTTTGADEFIIIACDGLWDVMSSQQAVNYVRRQLATHGDLVKAANELVQKSIELYTIDNVTAIIIAFQRDGGSEGEAAVAGDSLMTV